MELTGTFGVAPKILFIELFGQNLIDIALNGDRKAHDFIFKKTIMGPKGYLQILVFISVFFL